MIEKIDIIEQVIYKYDDQFQPIGETPLTSDYDAFINEFSDTQDLLTINISQPIKRIMKFYSINMGVPTSFDEIDYENMTDNQKIIVDDFIELIKNA
jgi:hypothetical protein